MNHAQQPILALPGPTHRKLEYVPPSAEMIRRYSHVVARRLYSDAVAQTNFTELCQGFTEFVSVVVRIQTKARNRS